MLSSNILQRALLDINPDSKKSRSKRKQRRDKPSHSASPVPTPSAPKPESPLGPPVPKEPPDKEARPMSPSRVAPLPKAATTPASSLGNDDFIPFNLVFDFDDAHLTAQVTTEGRNRRGHKRSIEDMLDGEPSSGRSRSFFRFTPWAELVEWDDCRNAAEMLHYEVLAYTDYIKASRIEHDVRGMVIELIARSLQKQWPTAIVTPFGSYETRLYLPMGDLDLVVQLPTSSSQVVSILHQMATTLKLDGIAKNVQVIAKAKVPIIKFVSVHGSFLVDISVNQINGVTAGQIVNKFLSHYPVLQPLVLIIKAFLNQRSMNEVFSGGLGSYSIVCMALSFIQMHPKIRNGEIDPMENLGVIVVEFFEFYGHVFNYDDAGISLRDGGNYFNKERRGWKSSKQAYLLSIEDPADEENDVSSGSYGILRVRKTLAGAFEVLSATMLERAEQLTSLPSRGTRDYSRDRDWGDSRKSILGSILTSSEEVEEHRRAVKSLWKSGILQRLLGRPVEYEAASGRRSSARPDSRTNAPLHSRLPQVVAFTSPRPPPLPLVRESPAAAVEEYYNMDSQTTVGLSQTHSSTREVVSPSQHLVSDDDDEHESRYAISNKKPRSHKSEHDITFITDDDASDGASLNGDRETRSGKASPAMPKPKEELPLEEGEILVSPPGTPEVGQEMSASKPPSRSVSVAERRTYWQGKSGNTQRSGSSS